jgi:hypothetical protein
VHVSGNSKTVINAAHSNGFGKQSLNRARQDLRKTNQTHWDINKKIVAVFT